MPTPDEQLDAAFSRVESGDLVGAEHLCRAVLAQQPDNPEALHLLGAVILQRGDAAVALPRLQNATHHRADNPTFFNTLGIALMALGKTNEAAQAFQQAITLDGSMPDAHYNLGNALRRSGHLIESIRCYETALRLRGDYPAATKSLAGALNDLGRTHQDAGELESAEQSYRKAIELRPEFPEAMNNLAAIFQVQGKSDEAIDLARKVLAQRPGFPPTLTVLGNTLKDKGDIAGATACYKRAIQHQPDLAEAHNNLGNICREQQNLDQAGQCYDTALKLRPAYPEANFNRATVYYEEGDLDSARWHYDAAILSRPKNWLWRLRRETLCPYAFGSTDEIDEFRARLESALDKFLSERPVSLDELVSAGVEPSFNLNYHARCNRTIKEKYGQLFTCLFPKYEPLKNSGKPHVGIVVTKQHEGVFLRSMKGTLRRLDRSQLAVTLFGHPSSESKLAETQPNQFIALPGRLDQAAEVIREAACDLLYYWEVGSDALNYFLPYFRLAPVQCFSWGTQDTSGIPSMDIHLSSDLIEVSDADKHYTEKLVRLRSLMGRIDRVAKPENQLPRSHFGLSESDHILLCPQNLLKFHPDFDALIGGILDSDPAAKLVIPEGSMQRHIGEKLRERFAQRLPGVADRIVFIPRPKGDDYYNLILLSDALLDPLHYGGVNTTYDALSLGVPVVTFPQTYQRARYTAGCYERIGLGKLVVGSASEYVKMAVRLVTEPDFRMEICGQIEERVHHLFEDEEVVGEHQRVFLETIAESRR